MTAPIVGIELHGCGFHRAAWRRADSHADAIFGAAYWRNLVDTAERAGIHFVIVADSFELQRTPGGDRGWLDAAGIAAAVAPVTTSIGLVPQVAVTHTEPFHVSKSIASLDFASAGRAGWEVIVSPDQARLFGRKPAQSTAALWDEAADAIEVVTALWDTWEDDAEIRDTTTGRFVDRDKLHYIDFVGTHFAVKGPSITPRPPQGRPLVVVRADGGASDAVAASRADVVRIAARDRTAAQDRATNVRAAIRRAGRSTREVAVLLDVDVHLAATPDLATVEVAELEAWSPPSESASVRYVGAPKGLAGLIDEFAETGVIDGVVLRPLATWPTVMRLGDVGMPASPPETLRRRLGFTRPPSRFANREA